MAKKKNRPAEIPVPFRKPELHPPRDPDDPLEYPEEDPVRLPDEEPPEKPYEIPEPEKDSV